MRTLDVAIVGAGPAGISCAIQLKRYGINPVVFEKDEVGGLLRNANLVENYPGFKAVPGVQLVEHFKEHFSSLNLSIMREEVRKADYDGENFSVTTDNKTYLSKVLVIASGTTPKTLKLNPDVQNRIFYNITALPKRQGKDILVVGSGDAAFDYAINLSDHNRVTILNRNEAVKCLPLLFDRAKNIDDIRYMSSTEIVKIKIIADKLTVTLSSGETINPDYVLGAIGREPNLELLTSQIKETRPSLEEKGVFYIIGDAANGIYRQTSIAVGNGVEAAMKIYEILKQ